MYGNSNDLLLKVSLANNSRDFSLFRTCQLLYFNVLYSVVEKRSDWVLSRNAFVFKEWFLPREILCEQGSMITDVRLSDCFEVLAAPNESRVYGDRLWAVNVPYLG